jgi:LDH2 family malate/lactate/ureidoglycolate dehydrogenase
MSNETRIRVEDLKEFCLAILVKLGIPAADAQIVTEALLDAELRGIDTHGLIRLNQYANLIRQKLINPCPQIKVIRESPGHILLDADYGMGFLGGFKAMQACINKAKKNGLAVAGVRRSSHFGAAGYYARLAAAENLIGMAASNCYPVMAPPGFITRTHGNNPLAWAIPTGENPPLVFDMATSVVSQGKMKKYADAGQKIPLGWAFDEHGQPIDDPASFFLLAPLGEGGYKGYGLAMVLDALAGVLTGSYFAREFTSGPGSRGCGHFFMAIDPQLFMPLDTFKKRMDAMIAQVKKAEPAPGRPKVAYIPGERGAEKMRQSITAGVVLAPTTMKLLHNLGKELGVPSLFSAQE